MGTVQLGIPYGIANQKGQPDSGSAFSILDAAHACGITMLDTSRAYGTSEEVIGAFSEKTGKAFDIVSKFPNRPNVSADGVAGALGQSLKRLRAKSLYGYLIHDFKTYREHPEVWDSLVGLKNNGMVKKVGFSVYYPQEIELLLDRNICPDIIQLPYSVLDTRFEQIMPELRRRSIEIHARSVFLQGAVFLPDDKLTGALQGAVGSISRLRDLSMSAGFSVLDLCLMFVVANESVDRIVIGVDSEVHLRQNVKAFGKLLEDSRLFSELKQLAVNIEKVVVPCFWT